MSAAWPYLRDLTAGDVVPAELYVLDYRDGVRPRWQVASRHVTGTGSVVLVLVDPDNGAGDLFDDGTRAALTLITHPRKTLRSGPHRLGGPCEGKLCDLDQQGRHAEKAEPRTT